MADRILRSTHWMHPDHQMHAIVRDKDVMDTLESMRESLLGVEGPGFWTFDIFTAEGPVRDEIDASRLAMARWDQDAERNMCILYFWMSNALLTFAKPNAIILNPSVAPLDSSQVEAVYLQLVRHPAYQNQMLVTHADDGAKVTAEDGAVTVDTDPGREHAGS